MQRAEPTSPVASNITTPNDDTTIGIAARAPPENAQSGNHFIVMHGQGPLSCSKDAEKLQYLEDSMVSMKNQLRSANEVLSVPGVQWSVGASVFFGPSTLLTCLHGLNAEFGAALSSDAKIASIRTTYYARPMQFISSADEKPIESYDDMKLYPHGKAVLFGCPTTAEAEWRAKRWRTRCVDDEKTVAYTAKDIVLIGSIAVNQIFLCPRFFEFDVLNKDNSGTMAMIFKKAFKNIVQGQNPQKKYGPKEAGA